MTSRQDVCCPAPIENSYWLPGGRIAAGEYPGHDNKVAAREKIQRLLDAGVRSFVDLTTTDDPLEPYEDIVRDVAGDVANVADVRYRRMSIRDMSVPSDGEMREILDHVDTEVESGRVVYVHCWGGVGRTGTVVGCHLVREGWSGDAALATVNELFATMSSDKCRWHPEGSPQTERQREFVRAWREDDSRRSAPTRFPRASLQRRFRGCLLGGAVGDALGAPVEFMYRAAIESMFGEQGITEFAGSRYGPAGCITDDTQMTLFTAEGILRGTQRRLTRGDSDHWHDGVHSSAMAYVSRNAYLRWLHTQGGAIPEWLEPRDSWLVRVPELHARRAPGNTCLSALAQKEGGTRDRPLNNSKGCGGVMRAAPAGLVNSDDAFAYGADLAAITHGHPSGYLAAGALAHIIYEVTRGASLTDAVRSALERLRREPKHDETSEALTSALQAWRRGDAPDVTLRKLGTGWTAEEALAIAVYASLVAGSDFASGVRMAVNHDGDSDSTGAIAGNILGALLGVEAIPARWVEQVEMRDVITAVADDLLAGHRAGSAWRERYPGS